MTVHYQLEGDVAVLTLARPDRFNSVSAELSAGLVAALGRAGDEARVAIVTGSGKAFCAGADLSDLMSEYDSGGPDLYRVIGERFNPIADALFNAGLPTVAAVNGVAAGAGMGIALGCDLRLFAPNSYLLSAFIGLGLVPDTGSTWLLVKHLGLSRALEFTATNRRLGADEAATLGLGKVATGDLLEEALGLASQLADGPKDAYVANRRILWEATDRTFAEAVEEERKVQGELGVTAQHLEGMKAFLEKRPPNFRS
jgi:2-(1,2-epoxy-1,2-dihydrophenyl)acetyl-CoA isomerase